MANEITRLLDIQDSWINQLLDRVGELEKHAAVRDAEVEQLALRLEQMEHREMLATAAMTALLDRIVFLEKRNEALDTDVQLILVRLGATEEMLHRFAKELVDSDERHTNALEKVLETIKVMAKYINPVVGR